MACWEYKILSKHSSIYLKKRAVFEKKSAPVEEDT
jgi:hypothetical protein